ncbi:copper amine oxidase N-terminal domain-containing protein [Paenibacillus sp. MMO-58]|uniref:copper amine oxidase N-terminal domain-containing protein n=1 Tax=Paenibacillus sp. MMO-58 TaxID=3081290 RepID=UPI00301663BD
MKNKWIILLLVFSLAFPFQAMAAAQNKLKVLVDGKAVSLSQPPVVKNGTNMLPAIPVLKSLGLSIEADTKAGTIKASKSGKVIWLKIGSILTTVNGITVPIEEPVQTIKGTTMVPARFITDVLGAGLKVTKDSISITNTNKETMFDIDANIVVSANYVKNASNTNFSEVGFTDFYISVTDYDIITSDTIVKGLDAGSTKKYNNFEITKSRYSKDADYFYIGSVLSYYMDEDQLRLDNPNFNKIKSFYQYDGINGYLDKVYSKIYDKRMKSAPIKIESVYVTFKGDTPYFEWTVKNISSKTITYYDFQAYCIDRYGKLTPLSSPYFAGKSENNNWKPGETITQRWSLYDHPMTEDFRKTRLNEVRFKDGTKWTF